MQLIDPGVLTPELAAEIPGMPYPAIERNVVLAARAFCEASPVWQDSVDVTAAGRTIDLAGASADAEVVRLMARGLSQNGRQLPASARPDASTLGYYERSRRVLWLTQTPTDSGFVAIVQLRPRAESRLMPDDVFYDYRDAIVSGALYRAYRMLNEPWANGEAAQVHLTAFNDAIERSKSDVRRTPTEVT